MVSVGAVDVIFIPVQEKTDLIVCQGAGLCKWIWQLHLCKLVNVGGLLRVVLEWIDAGDVAQIIFHGSLVAHIVLHPFREEPFMLEDLAV